MSAVVLSEADLHRANIRLAWTFSDRMTDAQFAQLCRVTAEQLQRDEQDERAARDCRRASGCAS